ncbi:MAG: hypothetical protein QOJ73_4613 [Streptosporangiaceae bacterium]|jgi:hypothetical protein|nr:hypothetical protein [Streptosporangiaceae bacterium]
MAMTGTPRGPAGATAQAVLSGAAAAPRPATFDQPMAELHNDVADLVPDR